MKNERIDEDKLMYLLSFMLPKGMLCYFEIVRIDEDAAVRNKVYTGGVMHIYLDELDNKTEDQGGLRPNGFTEPTLISDFPIRDRKVMLHVRRRRWLDGEGRNVILNVYDLVVTGTRYSEEFAAFLKERLGYVPRSRPVRWSPSAGLTGTSWSVRTRSVSADTWNGRPCRTRTAGSCSGTTLGLA